MRSGFFRAATACVPGTRAAVRLRAYELPGPAVRLVPWCLVPLLMLGLVRAFDAQQRPRMPSAYTLDEILDAIRVVESGNHVDGGRSATGDGGRAIGPYQVHRAHWLDSRLAGRFEDCRDPEYARREVLAYWRRWCPRALESRDAEALARVHNGGPDGAREACTLPYWRKVEARLERARALREPVEIRRSPRYSGIGRASAASDARVPPR